MIDRKDLSAMMKKLDNIDHLIATLQRKNFCLDGETISEGDRAAMVGGLIERKGNLIYRLKDMGVVLNEEA